MYGLDVEKDSWVLAYCMHKYYHDTSDGDESPLSDQSYDALKDIIIANWDLVPDELKKKFISPDDIKYSGCHVKLNSKQLAHARTCLK